MLEGVVARLVDVEDRFSWKALQQFLVGLFQGDADLANDLLQLAAGESNPNHVTKELADRGIGGVTESFEVSNQGPQTRADQSADLDSGGGRSEGDLAA